jgi:hypothetical protein
MLFMGLQLLETCLLSALLSSYCVITHGQTTTLQSSSRVTEPHTQGHLSKPGMKKPSLQDEGRNMTSMSPNCNTSRCVINYGGKKAARTIPDSLPAALRVKTIQVEAGGSSRKSLCLPLKYRVRLQFGNCTRFVYTKVSWYMLSTVWLENESLFNRCVLENARASRLLTDRVLPFVEEYIVWKRHATAVLLLKRHW